MIADIVAKTLKQRMTPAGPAASAGRKGDEILAHISPEEAELLKRRGGAGTLNPRTGVMEFYAEGEAPGDGPGGSWDGYDSSQNTFDANQSHNEWAADTSAQGGAQFSGGGGGGFNAGGYSPPGTTGFTGIDTGYGNPNYAENVGGIVGSYGGGSVSGPGGGAAGSVSSGYDMGGGFDPGFGGGGFNGMGTAIGDSSIGGISTAMGDPALGGVDMSPAQAGGVGAGTPSGAGQAATAEIPADAAQTQGIGFGGWSPFGFNAENVATGRPTNGMSSFGFGNLGMGNLPAGGALLSSTVEDGPVYGLPETLSPAAGLRGMAADPTGRHPGGPGDDGGPEGSVSVGGGGVSVAPGGSVTTDAVGPGRGFSVGSMGPPRSMPETSFGFGAGMSKAKGQGYANPASGPGAGGWGSGGQFATNVPTQTTVAREFIPGTPIADAAAKAYAANPNMPRGYLEGMYGVESVYGTKLHTEGSSFHGPYQQDQANIERFAGKGANPYNPDDATRAVANEYAMAASRAGRNLTPAEAFVVHNQGMTYSPDALNNPTDKANEWWDSGNIRSNNRNPNMSVADFVKSWEPNFFGARLDYSTPQGTVPGIDSMMFR